MSRPPGAIPPPHPAGGVASGVGPNQGSGPPPGYVGNQQQAAMMKQMMAMEQEKRVQMHMMEQQKQQLLREQRQQQQQLLAEQVGLTPLYKSLHEMFITLPHCCLLACIITLQQPPLHFPYFRFISAALCVLFSFLPSARCDNVVFSFYFSLCEGIKC